MRRGPRSRAEPRPRRVASIAPSTRTLGDVLAVLRAARRSCCSPRTRPTPSGCSARRTRTPYVKDGINDCVVDGAAGRGQPGARSARRRRRTTAARSPPARPRRVRAAADATTPQRRTPVRATSTHVFADAPARGRRVLRRRSAPPRLTDDARRVQRQAFAGLLWSKQFYHYDVDDWLDGDPGQPPPPPSAQHGPQPRLAAPQQRRHHLDARQVGVPLVRRLGPGVPLHPAGAGRPGLRQGAADAAAARVVHAPERPAPGLRVGLRRRQPAGARLGGLARLQDRADASRRRRPRASSSASSTSCC